ncbi:membrane protein [Lactiplantibacillus plantarum EGD-AQ4]|nr:membrane protein [Lactiplantibacillus plantarum EGD-AQ4]
MPNSTPVWLWLLIITIVYVTLYIAGKKYADRFIFRQLRRFGWLIGLGLLAYFILRQVQYPAGLLGYMVIIVMGILTICLFRLRTKGS